MTALLASLILLASPARSQIKDSDAPSVPAAPAGFAPTSTEPTVVCDGKGGYRVELFGKGALPNGKCLREHEELHIKDLLAFCPEGCKGQKDGAMQPYQTDPKKTPGMIERCPKLKDFELYWRWKIDSECRAYKVQYDCTQDLIKKGKDNEYNYLKKKGLKDAERGFNFWTNKGLTEAKPKLECKWEP